nr:hypothetical protein [Mucilaginibacter sp. L294]
MKRFLLVLIIPAIILTSCAGKKELNRTSNNVQDGSSFQTAVVIQEKSEKTGINAEYAWVKANHPGASSRSQSLIYHDKKPYDILKIKTADGKDLDLYFDISNFYGKF